MLNSSAFSGRNPLEAQGAASQDTPHARPPWPASAAGPPTVTAGQRMVPLVVPLAHERLIVAQRVPGVAAESHGRPDAEVTAVPMAVDGDPGVQAGV